jgi:hypothetical protein
MMSSTPRRVFPALADAVGLSRACCKVKMLATGWSKEKPLSLLSLSPLVPRWEANFLLASEEWGRNVAQTSESAVSRISQSANETHAANGGSPVAALIRAM